jgi:hypothetical protein
VSRIGAAHLDRQQRLGLDGRERFDQLWDQWHGYDGRDLERR